MIADPTNMLLLLIRYINQGKQFTYDESILLLAEQKQDNTLACLNNCVCVCVCVYVCMYVCM